jgi:hypothetical protein
MRTFTPKLIPMKHEEAEGMAYFDPKVGGDFSYYHTNGERATIRKATKEIICPKDYNGKRERMLPQRWRGMCVIAEYTPEAILPLRGDHSILFNIGGMQFPVNMEGTRYRVFAESVSCYKCGRTGTLMRLEYDRHPKGIIEAHFNLYAVNDNGTVTLMTQDHIIPRSKGGRDHDDNLRTMCLPCNMKKGNKIVAEL